MYGACTSDREHVCLIMEKMVGGILFQRIYDPNKRRMSYLEILQVGPVRPHRSAGIPAAGCHPPFRFQHKDLLTQLEHLLSRYIPRAGWARHC